MLSIRFVLAIQTQCCGKPAITQTVNAATQSSEMQRNHREALCLSPRQTSRKASMNKAICKPVSVSHGKSPSLILFASTHALVFSQGNVTLGKSRIARNGSKRKSANRWRATPCAESTLPISARIKAQIRHGETKDKKNPMACDHGVMGFVRRGAMALE